MEEARTAYFFLGAAFLAGFLAAGFLTAFLGFLAAFLALGFLTAFFFSALGFSASLKQPAPFLPAAPPATTFLASAIFLRAFFTPRGALAASTLLLAITYLRMAWREEPFLSLRALMAAAIITA